MIIKLFYIFFFALLSMSGRASDICNNSTALLGNIESVYKSGKFRIYYSKNPSSPDYLTDMTDQNSNNIPDYVENIAIQANATTDALTYLGFTHPLESERYKGVAEYIDIHVNLSSGNGLAYEGVTNYINKINKENKCTLILQVRKNLENFPANWATVAHEIFHLYEYGYSQFKEGWYIESMAKWSENVLRAEQLNEGTVELPKTINELNNSVYGVEYNQLWYRLAYLSDSSTGQLVLPSELLNRTYINGSKVFKNEIFKGHSFMKKVLENFKLKSDQISFQNNWNPHRWSESAQLNTSNRAYMLDAIQETMLQFGMNRTTEESTFINLN